MEEDMMFQCRPTQQVKDLMWQVVEAPQNFVSCALVLVDTNGNYTTHRVNMDATDLATAAMLFDIFSKGDTSHHTEN